MASTDGSARVTRTRLVAAALAAVAPFLFVTDAGAATTDAAGWWSSTSSPLPVDPAAPQVVEGQLHVQGDPSGPTAVAAVRWTLAEGETSPVLRVAPADGSVVPPNAILLACRAVGPWEEASGGAMDDAPEADCATPATGVVADDRSSIELDLASLLTGTTLDVVLMPGRTAEGVGSTFSLTFDRPAPEALTTSSGTTGSSGSSDPSGTTDASGSTAGSDQTAYDPDVGSSFTAAPSGGTSFAAPATGDASFTVPGAEAPTAPAPSESASSAATGSGAAQNTAAAADRGSSSSSSGSGRTKALGLAVLLAGVAVLAWAWAATAAGATPARAVADVRPLLARRQPAQ